MARMTRGRDKKYEVDPWTELKEFSFSTSGSRRGRCLYPVEPACTNKSCKAHSIQNRTVLDSLAVDGHVIMVRSKRLDSGEHVHAEFDRVGRKVATTFTGLCASHDATLFAPIDNSPLDFEDREQMFLLAYRSVLREAHAIATTAGVLEKVLEKRAQLKLPDLEQATVAGDTPIGILRGNVGPVQKEKSAFDQAYLDGRFEEVEHEIAWTPLAPPSLAVNSFFSLGCNSRTEREMPVALNVFPHNGRHAVVVSFRTPSKSLAQGLVFALKQTTGEERFRAVSRLVLKDSENFVLKPSLYESFGEIQRQLMRDYFVRTVNMYKYGHREIEPVPGLVRDNDVDKLNLFRAVDP
jgi:hypothetical protein